MFSVSSAYNDKEMMTYSEITYPLLLIKQYKKGANFYLQGSICIHTPHHMYSDMQAHFEAFLRFLVSVILSFYHETKCYFHWPEKEKELTHLTPIY